MEIFISYLGFVFCILLLLCWIVYLEDKISRIEGILKDNVNTRLYTLEEIVFGNLIRKRGDKK